MVSVWWFIRRISVWKPIKVDCDITKFIQKLAIYPSDNKSQCPVAVILKYHSKLPAHRKCPALYLQPKVNPAPGDMWFYDVAIGLNKLQGYVKDMCSEAGFTGKFTNHSLHSTLATRMYDTGVDEQTICEFTGHRSNAVRSYKCINEGLKRKATETLTRPSQKCPHKTSIWTVQCTKWLFLDTLGLLYWT